MSTTEDVLAVEVKQFEAVPVVDSQAAYESVAGDVGLAKAYLKKVDEFCGPLIAAGLASHRAALAQRAKLAGPAEAFEKVAKRAMGDFVLAEQAKRRAEEAKAAAEAKAREDERLALAAKASEEGREKEAEAILETALAPPAPTPILVAPPRAQGTAATVKWRGRVVDLAALCGAISRGEIPSKILSVNEGELNRAADSIANSAKWPGVEWYEDVTIRSRAS